MTTTTVDNSWTALVRQELPSGATVRKVAWMALRACIGLTVVSFALTAGLALVLAVVVGNVVRNGPAIVGNGVQCDVRKLRVRHGIGHAGFSTLGKALSWAYRFVLGGKA